jgi:hypothetical protein
MRDRGGGSRLPKCVGFQKCADFKEHPPGVHLDPAPPAPVSVPLDQHTPWLRPVARRLRKTVCSKTCSCSHRYVRKGNKNKNKERQGPKTEKKPKEQARLRKEKRVFGRGAPGGTYITSTAERLNHHVYHVSICAQSEKKTARRQTNNKRSGQGQKQKRIWLFGRAYREPVLFPPFLLRRDPPPPPTTTTTTTTLPPLRKEMDRRQIQTCWRPGKLVSCKQLALLQWMCRSELIIATSNFASCNTTFVLAGLCTYMIPNPRVNGVIPMTGLA